MARSVTTAVHRQTGHWQTGGMSQWRTPAVVLIWIPVTLGLDAGATLLQAYTAFVYEGALWPSRIQRDLLG